MSWLAMEEDGALPARAVQEHHQQLMQSRAAQLRAERAFRLTAERVLTQIEGRVSQVPGPQGDPLRLPAGGPRLAERFLWASATYLRMDLGAVVLVLDGNYLGPILSSQPSRNCTDLHFTYGEGPAIEAGSSGTFIEVRDYREAGWRWPALAPAALEAGFRSAWCIPLADPDKPGLVLCYVGQDPIPYTLPRYERLSRVTRIAQSLLIDHPGTITTQAIARRIDQAVRRHAVTYQASGVLAERLSINCDSALSLMRLQAWAEKRPLHDVSEELIAQG